MLSPLWLGQIPGPSWPMSDTPSKSSLPASSNKASRSNGAPRHRRVPAAPRPKTPVDAAPADPGRVLSALERSLSAAKGGTADQPILLVRQIDLAGLGAKDLRPQLDEIMVSPHADAGLDSLLTTGLLESLLPEVEAMVGFGDGEWRHKDVWKHTKQVVIQTVPRLQVRWSALFHDIGKVRTRTVSERGEVHFFGHAEVGARMFDKMDRRVRLFAEDQALKDEVQFLVLHHLRAGGYSKKWTDSAVRRFSKEMGPYLDDLLCLSRADITTKRPEKKRRGVQQIHDLSERVDLLAAEDEKVPPLPKGVGTFIVAEFNLPPSKIIGNIMRALEAACDSGELEPGQESDYYVQFVAKNRERFGLSA